MQMGIGGEQCNEKMASVTRVLEAGAGGGLLDAGGLTFLSFARGS
jgi:hypothetical protein